MKSLFALIFIFAAPQAPVNVPATGEYRAAAGENVETAKQLALADARRNALREAVTRLQSTAEVKGLSLKPNQL
jgi:hypothetical protein